MAEKCKVCGNEADHLNAGVLCDGCLVKGYDKARELMAQTGLTDPKELTIKHFAGPDYTDPSKPHPLVTDGKLKIQGIVLKKILNKGPPSYVVGWRQNRVIYAAAYSEMEIWDKGLKLTEIKKCSTKDVLIAEINGKGLYDAMIKGGMKAEKVIPERIYEVQCLKII